MSKSASASKASKQAQKAATKPRKKAEEDPPTEETPKSETTKVTQDEDTSPATSTKKPEKDTTPTVDDASESEQEDEDKEQAESETNKAEAAEGADYSDLELEDDKIVFVTHHWDGTYPKATGLVAKYFAKVPPAQQIRQLEDMYKVDKDTNKFIMKTFKGVDTPFAMAVPGAGNKIKIVYALTPVTVIEEVKDTYFEDTTASLTGELVPGATLPSTLLIPDTAFKAKQVKIPAGDAFNKKRLDPAVTKTTWFSAKKLKFTAILPAIIPVPACIVYDSFDKEIEAIVVYERWMNLRQQYEEVGSKLYNQVARSWLKAQLVTPTSADPQTREHPSVFLVQPLAHLHQ